MRGTRSHGVSMQIRSGPTLIAVVALLVSVVPPAWGTHAPPGGSAVSQSDPVGDATTGHDISAVALTFEADGDLVAHVDWADQRAEDDEVVIGLTLEGFRPASDERGIEITQSGRTGSIEVADEAGAPICSGRTGRAGLSSLIVTLPAGCLGQPTDAHLFAIAFGATEDTFSFDLAATTHLAYAGQPGWAFALTALDDPELAPVGLGGGVTEDAVIANVLNTDLGSIDRIEVGLARRRDGAQRSLLTYVPASGSMTLSGPTGAPLPCDAMAVRPYDSADPGASSPDIADAIEVLIPHDCLPGSGAVVLDARVVGPASLAVGPLGPLPSTEVRGLLALPSAPARPPATAVARQIDDTCSQGGTAFQDVGAGNVHAPRIGCIAEHDITHGTTATTFTPAGSLTRGQLAAFTARTLDAAGVPLPADPPDAYGDDDGGTHEADLDRLGAAGIFPAATTIGPATLVTRAEMARVVAAALVYAEVLDPDADVGDHFPDDTYHPDGRAIDQVASVGIVTGREDGTFDPNATVRRDQMATFLARLLDALLDAG